MWLRTQAGNYTADCPRTGGTAVTVRGTNLGVSAARVIVAGLACVNVTHNALTPHEQLVCKLPAAAGQSLPLLLFQDRGEMTPQPLFLSYQPCAFGSYPSGLSCPLCAAGTITNVVGQAQCANCEHCCAFLAGSSC